MSVLPAGGAAPADRGPWSPPSTAPAGWRPGACQLARPATIGSHDRPGASGCPAIPPAPSPFTPHPASGGAAAFRFRWASGGPPPSMGPKLAQPATRMGAAGGREGPWAPPAPRKGTGTGTPVSALARGRGPASGPPAASVRSGSGVPSWRRGPGAGARIVGRRHAGHRAAPAVVGGLSAPTRIRIGRRCRDHAGGDGPRMPTIEARRPANPARRHDAAGAPPGCP